MWCWIAGIIDRALSALDNAKAEARGLPSRIKQSQARLERLSTRWVGIFSEVPCNACCADVESLADQPEAYRLLIQSTRIPRRTPVDMRMQHAKQGQRKVAEISLLYGKQHIYTVRSPAQGSSAVPNKARRQDTQASTRGLALWSSKLSEGRRATTAS